ncbi:unnamed protein product [Caenorhabditis auriculariae]|uniref:Uncharacterized protein n=1 Tax=Caenorhabditis auriculariae TaxID=2777116 RepID=A0A8S1GRD3_9PELO|nr:unnamed protein product [Caenorhabditis auriculariae]
MSSITTTVGNQAKYLCPAETFSFECAVYMFVVGVALFCVKYKTVGRYSRYTAPFMFIMLGTLETFYLFCVLDTVLKQCIAFFDPICYHASAIAIPIMFYGPGVMTYVFLVTIAFEILLFAVFYKEISMKTHEKLQNEDI